MTMKHANVVVSFVCAATMALSAAAPAFAHPVCNTPEEISAVQLRQLQIQMMVSTLRCDSSTYDFHTRYGSFMANVNPLMPSNMQKLKAMLNRQRIRDADHYLTLMSIDAQNLSQRDPEYCGRAVRILEEVSALPSPTQVLTVAAQSIPSPYEVVACPEHSAPVDAHNKHHRKHHVQKTASN